MPATSAFPHHSFFSEVDAHCGGELAVELVVGVPVEEGGLSHARVPQRQKLDQVVVIPVSHCAAVFSTCHSATCAGVLEKPLTGVHTKSRSRWVSGKLQPLVC